MIPINKEAEPQEWTNRRTTPGVVKFEPIRELKEALLREQGYLCAYCMRRIPAKDGRESADSKVEHLKSQYDRGDLQMEYTNLAICCPGYLRSEAHCDKSKGPRSISFDLHSPELSKAVLYNARDGSIYSKDEVLNSEMNELLNLNHYLLKYNRLEKLEALREEMNRLGWKKGTIRRKLEKYSSKNQEGKLEPFCGIMIWYLQRKISDQNNRS